MASQQPPGDAEPRVRPMILFRWGLYVSLGVLATAAAAAAVYTTRGVLTEALISLFLAISLDPACRGGRRRPRSTRPPLVTRPASSSRLVPPRPGPPPSGGARR
jgi:hypothetical protein